MPVGDRFYPDFGPDLCLSVLAAMSEAQACREMETFAAVMIQSAYRSYRQRRAFAATHSAAVAIQSVFRGHRQRGQQRLAETLTEKKRQQAVFNFYATRIQALFRGYSSRKKKDDYYARKRYIVDVTQRSYDLLALSAEVNAEHTALERLRASEVARTTYARATEKAHHVLSTDSVSGVYRRPPLQVARADATGEERPGPVTTIAATTTMTPEGTVVRSTAPLGNTMTDFGTSLEEDIRANAATARRAELRRTFLANASTALTGAGAAGTVGGPPAAVGLGDAPTVAGVLESVVRHERQVRRGQYSEMVRDNHFSPKALATERTAASSTTTTTPPAGAAATTATTTTTAPAEEEEKEGTLLKNPRPLIWGTATVNSILPPIERPTAAGGSDTSEGPTGSTTAAGLTSSLRLGPRVPWENDDVTPPVIEQYQQQQHQQQPKKKRPELQHAATFSGRIRNGRVIGGRQGKDAVSSHNAAFRVHAHDCPSHTTPVNFTPARPLAATMAAATTGGEYMTVRDGVVDRVTEAEALGSREGLYWPATAVVGEAPLHDTRPAALKRAVDSKVAQSLHGNATFKV